MSGFIASATGTIVVDHGATHDHVRSAECDHEGISASASQPAVGELVASVARGAVWRRRQLLLLFSSRRFRDDCCSSRRRQRCS